MALDFIKDEFRRYFSELDLFRKIGVYLALLSSYGNYMNVSHDPEALSEIKKKLENLIRSYCNEDSSCFDFLGSKGEEVRKTLIKVSENILGKELEPIIRKRVNELNNNEKAFLLALYLYTQYNESPYLSYDDVKCVMATAGILARGKIDVKTDVLVKNGVLASIYHGYYFPAFVKDIVKDYIYNDEFLKDLPSSFINSFKYLLTYD
ncbi:hypothetical protein [Pyrobaculum aerophilum]|uniref:Uncharacterized protein n=1 Tax=Pyrobaculum aerophilum TaxID=13773 RepID=A0A371R747_9CREN|nr:hypothetical protein [Pyrobaculum aerophilum]RFA96258.1 hypothetical protein CGL51_05495 [Pyrobaculum aerophilum]RFB00363.1 hypothetical protein CGL52_00435 [Pyrobaculum aerophilum]